MILSSCTQRCYGRKIDKPLVVYRFYCMALYHSQTRRHMIHVLLNILQNGENKRGEENMGQQTEVWFFYPLCSNRLFHTG